MDIISNFILTKCIIYQLPIFIKHIVNRINRKGRMDFVMYPFLLAASNTPADTETIDAIGSMINKYGFMVVFSVIVLILVVFYFVNHDKRNGKKQDSELQILTKERESAIEQNKQMFDLVTKVQTEQVVQLQQMTDSLKDMNRSVQNNEKKMTEAYDHFEEMRVSVRTCDENSKVILETISEILEYVKTSQNCNQEILDKVNLLEKRLIIDESKNQD